ncbi:hypothetical protein FACS1894200_07070 [Spirochaetia bacterium]|nr:hypothetical protein FACS1894200_07070 [Spirochaetia bacterium]
MAMPDSESVSRSLKTPIFLVHPPFKTLAKAVDTALKGTTVKTITIIGTLNSTSEGTREFYITNNGTAEILITGKSDSEKGYLMNYSGYGGGIKISGKSQVRFENVVISGGYQGGGGGGMNISEAAVTLGKGVEIRRNRASNNGWGGGVRLNSGTLTMLEGAEISENIVSIYASGNYDAYSRGGGVYVAGGTFIMSGGTISGNTGSNGGGVYGSVIMSGGSISGNTTNGNGGGVYGSVIMSGGSISGNTANGNGGGVSGSVIMSGLMFIHKSKSAKKLSKSDFVFDGICCFFGIHRQQF